MRSFDFGFVGVQMYKAPKSDEGKTSEGGNSVLACSIPFCRNNRQHAHFQPHIPENRKLLTEKILAGLAAEKSLWGTPVETCS